MNVAVIPAAMDVYECVCVCVLEGRSRVCVCRGPSDVGSRRSGPGRGGLSVPEDV